MKLVVLDGYTENPGGLSRDCLEEPGELTVYDRSSFAKVAAAGLDVVSTEPIRGDNPLLNAKNRIITPHISWAPKESRQRVMDCSAANGKAFLEGRPINVVNGL